MIRTASLLLLAFAAGGSAGWLAKDPSRADLRDAAEARAARTAEAWDRYLERHPTGFHAPEAHAWLADLRRPPAAPPSGSQVEALSTEIRAWEARFAAAAPPPAPAVEKKPVPPSERPPVRPLAPGADRESVDAYLVSVQRRLAGIPTYRRDDPDRALLLAVPKEHIDLLLAAAATSRSWMFKALAEEVLPTMHGLDDPGLVKSWIQRVPVLIRPVLDHGWERDFHDQLTANVRAVRQMGTQVLWVRAIAKAGEPKDYALLEEVLVDSQYGYWRRDLFREMEKLPEFPAQRVVQRCWETRKPANGVAAFFPVAAEYGIREALAQVVACVAVPQPHLSTEKADAWLAEHSDAPDDPARLGAWLGTAEDPPRFDPATRRWTRGAAPAGF